MKSRHLTNAIITLIFLQIEWLIVVNSICGKRLAPRNPLITEGFISNDVYWPWHAAIYYVDEQQNGIYVCGGTLVDSNFILTAAHCVCNYDVAIKPEKVFVSLGRQSLNVSERNSQSFNVSQIILHPDFSSVELHNDIAMIKLSTEAYFNNYVQPICLWDSSKLGLSEVIGRLGTVIGWGNTETDNLSDILKQGFMPVVPSFTCLISNRNFFSFYLSETNFCAGFRNGTSVCNGDSGGSMTFEEEGVYYIRGISSVSPARMDKHGKPEDFCDAKQYAIFTDVAKYLPWIDQMVTQSVHCEKTVNCYVQQGYDINECHIDIAYSERNCKIIFGEVSNTNISVVRIYGTLRAIPDISDAFSKLKNITDIRMEWQDLNVVERKKVAKLRTITRLSLRGNKIHNLAADTFDDLKNIEELDLSSIGLNAIHRDLFKELYKLRKINLAFNSLDVLPEGLFRNNQELEIILAQRNYLKVILVDFQNLPKLSEIDLIFNYCIHESYNANLSYYGTNSMEVILQNIQNNCKTSKYTE